MPIADRFELKRDIQEMKENLSQKNVRMLDVNLLLFAQHADSETTAVQVKGAVKIPLSLSLNDLRKMAPFHVNGLVRVEEKETAKCPDRENGTDGYRGVLLRDILEEAEMEFVRKWEPGVCIRVKGAGNREVVFSFGEIFYGSAGRSILLAYEKSGRRIDSEEGVGELAVATDVRAGRFVKGVREITVERVEIPLSAYDDRRKNIVRPPTTSLSMIDRQTGIIRQFDRKALDSLPQVHIRNALMAGDCEGFNGIYAYEGPLLRSVLEWFGLSWEKRDYARYVVVSSEDGFSAVFSMGEIFNSRLDNNIIIAGKKNGEVLGAKAGFAASVVGEDSAGGRSVKRISRIEVR